MDSLPDLPRINDDDPVDFIINISDQNNANWTVIKKTGTVGKFRSDLSKLKSLRKAVVMQEFMIKPVVVIPAMSDMSGMSPEMPRNQVSESTVPRSSLSSFYYANPTQISSKTIIRPSSSNPTPSNPLIDQTIHIYQPAKWIDCISRESKRIFVKDNWIVARILLPTVTKDSIGLKRLT